MQKSHGTPLTPGCLRTITWLLLRVWVNDIGRNDGFPYADIGMKPVLGYLLHLPVPPNWPDNKFRKLPVRFRQREPNNRYR